MELYKIHSDDLIFSGDIDDNRTNTYINLYDYDWMDYTLTTRFKTEKMGVLDIIFNYFGMNSSTMEVNQMLNGVTEKVIYEYPSKIFIKYITELLKKYIYSFDNECVYDGEEIVIDFYNEVIEKGFIKKGGE